MKNLGELVTEDEFSSSDDSEKIKSLITSSSIFLFMKGSPESPLCGFSGNIVQLLNRYEVPYKAFDVLSSLELKEKIKIYSDWYTYPQLYINGELIGGYDIIMELLDQGKLENILKEGAKAS